MPGGHSPPYFAILNQTLPMAANVWRNDPVSFDNYSEFFLAHELAHQWWGQAVGWKNYHEQWISEGFAQYFAALYAAEERGDDLLANLMRQMRRWAIQQSDEGPVYLGYRLGHIKGEGRVFRAIIYNKGAMVLHMLRRFVGDKIVLCRDAPLLHRVEVSEGGHRRLPRRDGGGRRARISVRSSRRGYTGR